MSILGRMLDRIRDRLYGPGPQAATAELVSSKEWYVKIPQHMRGEMVAHSGTIEDALDEMTPDNRKRLATLGCVGIHFESTDELHRWPWLEDERAWWQAIA